MITEKLVIKSGCEFVCKNAECKEYEKGFVVNSIWPLGKIELIISSSQIEKNEDLKRHLVFLKDNGEKFAPIQYPDPDNIEVVAYRVSRWSPEGKCIWKYDFELNGRTIEEAVKQDEIPTKCQKTGCETKDFLQVIEDGIDCPHCGNKMWQNTWFCKSEV